ncbi:phage major capsid protein [Microbispora triticiradicis]|uniref:phage major capsid protein n=1 Tax=Microbispora triticiradicis TaxID=2200763 RepID=UPI001AD7D5F9|nr:phage major capsid protein [Microbispora triticiradicis]MBO4274132.1 phage major capsid protein [Microbispora triticiradicis]
MLEFLRQQLATLLEERAALKSDLDGVLTAPRAEQRDLNEAEAAAFNDKRAALVTKDGEIEEMRGRIAELEDDEKREARAAELAAQYGQTGEQRERQTASVTVTSEPETYRKGGRTSYFKDLVRAQLMGSREAIDRLARNDREVAHALEKRALTTTDGAGGEFVPPLWMIDEYVGLARASRIVANRVRQMPLPAGTDSVSLPRLATGTAVAEQSTQNTAVQNTDATTNSVTAQVATIAGQQVVSLQLIEQSPINVDEVLLADLAADYAVKLDTFVISNNATNKVGLLNVSGANAITYTDASPTGPELYPKIADAIQQIHTGRFMPPDVIFMHPRRWAWLLAALDTAGRPLATPVAGSPQNVIAAVGDINSEGFVGSMQGLPVFVDPNIPTNLGAGTNEDRIIVARSSDVILFEGTPRSETFREPLAAQLSVLLRFYNYAALHASRYPKSVSIIAGTGLVTPTF